MTYNHLLIEITSSLVQVLHGPTQVAHPNVVITKMEYVAINEIIHGIDMDFSHAINSGEIRQILRFHSGSQTMIALV